MSIERKYLALDLGAESGRGAVGRFDGTKLELEEVHRWPELNVKLLDRIYWDIPFIFSNLKTALEKAGTEHRIDSLGIDTWGVDFGLLANDGTLLGNPVHYRDARTDGVMEKTFEKAPREEVFRQTGIQFMQINTIYQLHSMVLEQSPLLECADKLLMVPSLLSYLFTGRKVDEYTIASTTQLMNPRDGSWSRDLFDKLGIPIRLAPDVVQPGDVLGTVLPSVAEETRSGSIPVVAVGSHDTASAVAAVPAETGSWCYISCGTWSLMGIETAEPIINKASLAYNYTNEGGVGGTIRLLKNIMGLWIVQECKRHWAKEGEDISYADLTKMAAEAEPFRCFIDCTGDEFLAPMEMPSRIVEYCRKTGQKPPESKGQIIRCALESLALTYRQSLAALEDMKGSGIDVMHIVGGGTQNELLCQFSADACNRPVIAGPVEATAIGNLLMQAVALGDLSSPAEVREVVRNSFAPKHFEPQQTGAWDDAYAKFSQLCGR